MRTRNWLLLTAALFALAALLLATDTAGWEFAIVLGIVSLGATGVVAFVRAVRPAR